MTKRPEPPGGMPDDLRARTVYVACICNPKPDEVNVYLDAADVPEGVDALPVEVLTRRDGPAVRPMARCKGHTMRPDDRTSLLCALCDGVAVYAYDAAGGVCCSRPGCLLEGVPMSVEAWDALAEKVYKAESWKRAAENNLQHFLQVNRENEATQLEVGRLRRMIDAIADGEARAERVVSVEGDSPVGPGEVIVIWDQPMSKPHATEPSQEDGANPRGSKVEHEV